MNTTLTTTEPDVIYPDSDGMPMADNTLQYEWIVTIKGNLDDIFARNPDVFVAGDNLIYPVHGNNKIRMAPDVYVAFGRQKGYRGSYRVWEEGGIFPQVVFEVLSPGNRVGEMQRKRAFYRTHGSEEYYVIDPDDNVVEGWIRESNSFREVDDMNGFISPRLRIKFDTSGSQLVIYRPDGQRFLTFQEVMDRAASAEKEAEQFRVVAEQAHVAAVASQQETERLRALLRAAGIDPDKSSA
ncbi:MAG TPA: Uma2 family endonuclease [Gemmata sp.]|jgi:Uma2 family endonuclease|nr:Uma2 family endonuclease [Gemmata sp.]